MSQSFCLLAAVFLTLNSALFAKDLEQEKIIAKAKTSQNIKELSEIFLGTKYSANVLGKDEKELKIDLKRLDCFTYLDYLQSFRTSGDFRQNLAKIRYKNEISYQFRRHFFSDWSEIAGIKDALKTSKNATKIDVILNENEKFIKGIGEKKRTLYVLKRRFFSPEILCDEFKNGDYIGFFRGIKALDVSHVGLVLKDNSTPFCTLTLRHASSSAKKVIDQNLLDYLDANTGVQGILIYRFDAKNKKF